MTERDGATRARTEEEAFEPSLDDRPIARPRDVIRTALGVQRQALYPERFAASPLGGSSRTALIFGVNLLAWLVVIYEACKVWTLAIPGAAFFGCITGLAVAGIFNFLRAVTMTKVRVGPDGFTLSNALRKTSLPREAITRVTATNGAIVVESRGKRRTLRIDHAQFARSDAKHAAARKAEIIAGLFADIESGPRVPSVLESRLARGEQSVDAWRERLRNFWTDDYRSSASVDVLLALVEDAGVSIDARVGAALVLMDTDPSYRERIAFVARTTGVAELERELGAALTSSRR